MLFLAPMATKGWLLLAAFIVLIIATAWLPNAYAAPTRVVLTVLYLGISYLKSERI